MDPIVLHSFWTIIAFVVFIGIVIWAYSKNRRTEFDEAANLPFDEEDEIMHAKSTGEQHNV
jgi:cytochrome c oxidase cbb3-type subunit 4